MKHRLVKWIQTHSFPAQNSFEPKQPPKETSFGDGVLYNDVAYGNEYPNSYMDIYRCEKGEEKHPLIFYVHGGGFTWGSKEDGDPNAGKKANGDKLWFFKRFLAEGYDIVSVDYAFAPDYMYPTPILQIQQAMAFLMAHGVEYALNTDRLILCGSSAGGHIVGQYAAIQTNPDYAREMGIPQILKPGQIKCILFNSALIDPTRYDVTHNVGFDFLLRKCGQAYFGDKAMAQSAGAQQSNLLSWVTAQYPPSFLSDGNSGSFYDQAKDLHKHLQTLSVRTKLNIYPKSEVHLGHGYESFGNKYGYNNMEKMLAFLKQTMEGEL